MNANSYFPKSLLKTGEILVAMGDDLISLTQGIQIASFSLKLNLLIVAEKAFE